MGNGNENDYADEIEKAEAVAQEILDGSILKLNAAHISESDIEKAVLVGCICCCRKMQGLLDNLSFLLEYCISEEPGAYERAVTALCAELAEKLQKYYTIIRNESESDLWPACVFAYGDVRSDM